MSRMAASIKDFYPADQWSYPMGNQTNEMPEALVRRIRVLILVIHSAVFNTFRWILMDQCEPTFTFHHRSLNQAHHISNRADKSDQMAPSYTVWSGTVLLIQRWMHAGYNCHNLIGDFSPAVRPGERQQLRFQHLHSALNSLQPLILHELECQSHLP